MSTCQVLNKTLFESKNIESSKHEFDNAKPFRLIRLQSFLNKDFIPKLESSLDENITFDKKDNDLFRFFQSYGLQQLPQNTPIQDLIKSLYSKQFRDLLFKITGKKVNDKPDLFASCYTDTSYLLCHDDQVEDRSIAFILYLVPKDWNEKDGGALNIYNSYNVKINNNNNNDKQNSNSSNKDEKISVNVFPENKPFKQLIPERNSVVIFEVSDKSFHAVDEVLTENKNRIAIGGWWHAEDELNHNLNKRKVAIPDPEILWKESMKIKDDKLLRKWLNPTYLKDKSIKQLQTKFLEESHLTLMNFINEELYYKLLNQMFSVKCGDNKDDGDKNGMLWKLKGPIHRRLYYRLDGDMKENKDESEFALIGEFKELMESVEWKLFIEKITSLSLLKYNLETRKFNHKHYTIAHDLDKFKDLSGLDVNLQFIENEDNGWDPICGGSIYYTMGKQMHDDEEEEEDHEQDVEEDEDIDLNVNEKSEEKDNSKRQETESKQEKDAQEEENEDEEEEIDDNILMSIHAFPNTLSITYRSECGVMSFVKYLNHKVPCSKADFNQIWTVDDNDDDEDSNQDENETTSNNKKRKLDNDKGNKCNDEEPPQKKQKV